VHIFSIAQITQNSEARTRVQKLRPLSDNIGEINSRNDLMKKNYTCTYSCDDMLLTYSA